MDNEGAQETTFRSAQCGVKGIPRRDDADFHRTEQVHGSGLSSQKEMTSPRRGVGIPTPYFLVVDTRVMRTAPQWISRHGSGV